MVNEPEKEILTIPCQKSLNYVFYAIAREVLGQTEYLFEHKLHRQMNGNFDILLPRPSLPLKSCLIIVHGYRNGVPIFEWEKRATEVFK